MSSVLFVCLGNICRSPAAEGVLSHYVSRHPLTEPLDIDSAGTHDYHIGATADPRMLDAAERRGYQLTSRARQIQANDLQSFDLTIAMDHENLAHVQLLDSHPKSQVVLLSHFLDPTWPAEVPDPYFGGDEGFDTVLDMLEAACPGICAFFSQT